MVTACSHSAPRWSWGSHLTHPLPALQRLWPYLCCQHPIVCCLQPLSGKTELGQPISDEHILLDDNKYIADVLYEFRNGKQRDYQQSKLLFKKRMFRETDETITEPQFVNLSYVQASGALNTRTLLLLGLPNFGQHVRTICCPGLPCPSAAQCSLLKTV